MILTIDDNCKYIINILSKSTEQRVNQFWAGTIHIRANFRIWFVGFADIGGGEDAANPCLNAI